MTDVSLTCVREAKTERERGTRANQALCGVHSSAANVKITHTQM